MHEQVESCKTSEVQVTRTWASEQFENQALHVLHTTSLEVLTCEMTLVRLHGFAKTKTFVYLGGLTFFCVLMFA